MLSHNATLTVLGVGGNSIGQYIQDNIDAMTSCNTIGALCRKEIKTLPPPCQDRVLFILLVLWKFPICDDMHWLIMDMLKVKDVVDGGHPRDRKSWT